MDLSHLPSCMDEWANGMFLARERIMAQVCSAADRMFAVGVFMMRIPFSVA